MTSNHQTRRQTIFQPSIIRGVQSSKELFYQKLSNKGTDNPKKLIKILTPLSTLFQGRENRKWSIIMANKLDQILKEKEQGSREWLGWDLMPNRVTIPITISLPSSKGWRNLDLQLIPSFRPKASTMINSNASATNLSRPQTIVRTQSFKTQSFLKVKINSVFRTQHLPTCLIWFPDRSRLNQCQQTTKLTERL